MWHSRIMRSTTDLYAIFKTVQVRGIEELIYPYRIATSGPNPQRSVLLKSRYIALGSLSLHPCLFGIAPCVPALLLLVGIHQEEILAGLIYDEMRC